MTTVEEKLVSINAAKLGIKQALIAKGQNMDATPFSGYASKIGSLELSSDTPTTPEPTPWIRPADWLTLTAPLESGEKFIGLHAVYPDSNFLALSAAGAYTVDWGDGVTENFAANTAAYHQYDYNNTALDGTLSILGYKQALVTVTPQVAGTFTSLNLDRLHNKTGLSKYVSGFLDIAISGQYLSSITIMSSNILFDNLERANIVICDIRSSGLFTSLKTLQDVYIYIKERLPISVTFSSNKATAVNHKLLGGHKVVLKSIVTTTGLVEGNVYFVVNATTNTFQLSKTSGGSAITLTNDGSGVFKPEVDFTNMFQSCTSLTSVPLLDTSSVTNFNRMFSGCTSLTSVPLLDTSAGTNFSSMFNYCTSLTSVPLLDTTSGIDISYMFQNCTSLTSVPLLDTSAGTNFLSMFNSCSSLTSVPLLDTSAGTNFSSMFYGCTSLTSVPLLDTFKGTIFSSMFNYCTSLTSVPLLDTSSGTSFNAMFQYCTSLTSVPRLDTSAGTNFSGMLTGCTSLTSVPLLDTSAGTNFSGMLTGCTSLTSVPLLDTSAGTNFSGMFSNCARLSSVPLLDTSSGTNFTNMFSGCARLSSVPLLDTSKGTDFTNMLYGCFNLISGVLKDTKYTISYANCKLSETALTDIVNNLGRSYTQGQVLTISGNWGSTVINTTGTTIAGSYTVSIANTTGIEVGMQAVGNGLSTTNAASCTFQDAENTATKTAHGLSNDDEVSFASITNTIGIITNTIYFVVNKTIDTFQVALTIGGEAINLTTNGTGTFRYKSIVTSINPNVSVTLNRPATTSLSNNTVSFRTLNTYIALLKGWSVAG